MVKKRASKKKKQRSGMVHLDPDKVQRLFLRTELTKEDFCNNTDMVVNTLNAAMRGDGIYPSTSVKIAKGMGVAVEDLLPHKSENDDSDEIHRLPKTTEWEPDVSFGRWRETSNGLEYRICKMKHRHVEGRFGRGKFYDLLEVPIDERAAKRDMLARHAETSTRIAAHPNIATNLSVIPTPDGNAWWVVDRWTGGDTLHEKLLLDLWPSPDLPRLMRELALGLEALHAAGIVFRELSPKRVLINEEDGRAILTEFELAKFLDASPTVSLDWREDPYRAEEVESGNFDVRADLYSWARICVEAATGSLPPKSLDPKEIMLPLPKRIWRIVVDCLALDARERPENIQAVLKAIKNWK